MSSFSKTFRLIFVVFFLYLLGDVFYRWDGFRYYATFIEFVPAVALISIFWSVISVVTAIFVWMLFKLIERICILIGIEIEIEHLLFYAFILILSCLSVWKGKRLIWPTVDTSFQIKFVVLLSISALLMLIVWLYRDKVKQWTGIVIHNITPLVWLFGILVMLAVLPVVYYTWIDGPDIQVSQTITQDFPDKENRPNIILVTFDALSARNMSLYGYSRPTTPFITEWAKKASVFTRAEAASNFTGPTTATLMSGKRVWSHLRLSRMYDSRPVGFKTENLPFLLKKNGYYMMAFIQNPAATVDRNKIAPYFDIAEPQMNLIHVYKLNHFIRIYILSAFKKIKLYDWLLQPNFIFGKLLDKTQKEYTVTVSRPEIAFNKFLGALNGDIKNPYFAWIHLNPPHSLYLPPEPYMGMFDPSGKMRTNYSTVEGMENVQLYHKPEDFETLRARYDEFIRYCDDQFKDFMISLNKVNKANNTIIILSADHGEIFDHNLFGHGQSLYEPETHIPVIIKEPEQLAGKMIDDLVGQADIPATILELANIKVPLWMEGRSLVPLLRGETLPDRPVFSMVLGDNVSGSKITKGEIAVWNGDYKLIHYLDQKKSVLFNLRQDSDELIDLFDNKEEIGNRLLTLIKKNLAKANRKIGKGE